MATIHVDRARARRILAGDEQAFRALFDEFFPRLYRFALVRLDGDEDAARDVVQQAFVNAIGRLESYRGEAALYTWFCRICHNALVDHCRKSNLEARRLVWIDDNPELQAVLDVLGTPAGEGPEARAQQRDLARAIQAVLDHLPRHYGDVLEWKYVDGLTVKEIAERMGQGPKAAESLLTRAREAFREAVAVLGLAPELAGTVRSAGGEKGR